jgi:hypothetical protein
MKPKLTLYVSVFLLFAVLVITGCSENYNNPLTTNPTTIDTSSADFVVDSTNMVGDTIYVVTGRQLLFRSINNSNIRYWNWNFGNGLSATGNMAFNRYAADGLYNACLTTIDSQNVSTTKCKWVRSRTNNLPSRPGFKFLGATGGGNVWNYKWGFNDDSIFCGNHSARFIMFANNWGNPFLLNAPDQNSDGYWWYVETLTNGSSSLFVYGGNFAANCFGSMRYEQYYVHNQDKLGVTVNNGQISLYQGTNPLPGPLGDTGSSATVRFDKVTSGGHDTLYVLMNMNRDPSGFTNYYWVNQDHGWTSPISTPVLAGYPNWTKGTFPLSDSTYLAFKFGRNYPTVANLTQSFCYNPTTQWCEIWAVAIGDHYRITLKSPQGTVNYMI